MNAPGDAPKISVRDLHKAFGSNAVLRGVDLDLPAGHSLAVIGGSGTGKSVLIKSIIGLLEPDSGSIQIDGEETLGMSPGERERVTRKFGMLFQGAALFDSLPVWENVAFGLIQSQGMRRREARQAALEAMNMVGLDSDIADRSPAELSGGMQKRVGFARAIATDPDILFLDEPTAGLDPIMSNVINEIIIHGVEALGATTISITSDMVSARKISNRIAMIDDGHIIWDGPTMDIDESGNPVVERFIRSNVQIFQD